MQLAKLLINIALFMLFIIFSSEALNEWKGSGEELRSSNLTGEKIQSGPVVTQKHTKITRDTDYKDIIDFNLFSPKRVEFVPKVEVADLKEKIEQLPVASTKFTLYGIILMDDFKRALISNPTPKPGEPPDLWIKVGDSIGSLTVEEISSESIIVLENGKPYKVSLYDRSNPKSRVIIPKIESNATVTNVEKIIQSVPKTGVKSESEKETEKEGEYMDTPFGKVKRFK